MSDGTTGGYIVRQEDVEFLKSLFAKPLPQAARLHWPMPDGGERVITLSWGQVAQLAAGNVPGQLAHWLCESARAHLGGER